MKNQSSASASGRKYSTKQDVRNKTLDKLSKLSKDERAFYCVYGKFPISDVELNQFIKNRQ